MKYFFFLLPFLLASCARTIVYQPAASQPDGGETIYTHGAPAARARAGAAEVSAELVARGGQDLTIHLFLRNHGDSLFTFRPEDVRVAGYNAAGQRADFRVFTAEQYIRRQRTKELVIGGTIAAVAVGTAVAIAANSDRHDDDDNDADEALWWLWATRPPVVVPVPIPAPDGPADGLLRRHTLYPDESLQGLVKVRPEPGYDERIVVEVPGADGESVRLVFEKTARRTR